MKPGILQKVKKLVQQVKVVYVATADKRAVPHIAASEGLTFLNKGQIVFRAWFCLRTVQNLEENPKLTLAVLDPETQEGYQLTGEINRIEKGAMLDGFVPGKEKRGLPQAEHQLFIHIQEISELTSGPHSDEFLR
jgi:predicted pyridoxine 5'-phosphate oxidase superfamily flavin-nucleotide-binding protein